MDEEPDKLTGKVTRGKTLHLLGEQTIEETWLGEDGKTHSRVTTISPPLPGTEGR